MPGGHGRERGQIIVLFAISIAVVIAMVGLVIDGGAVYAQRRDQQSAADLAALAGADALLNGKTQAEATTVARGVAQSNGFGYADPGVSVSVTFPPGLVQVDIGAPHQNYFAGIAGQPIWQVSTTAQAEALINKPDTAVGAAPFILSAQDFNLATGQPLSQYTQSGCPAQNSDGVAGCQFGNGNGDVPNNATDMAWTLFGANVNTRDVASYLNELGYLNGVSGCSEQSISPVTYAANDYIGQDNSGMHNGAINQGGNCIIGLTLAVPITGTPITGTTCNHDSHTDGCFYGWAAFHVTGLVKQGNLSHVDGWFVPLTQGLLTGSLSDTNCSEATCPPIGPAILRLNLVN